MRGRHGTLRVSLEPVWLDAGGEGFAPALPPGRYVRLGVRDNGCGMDRATLARIFEPFFTTKPTGEGTGLGLAVVHGIVLEHDGAIAVESEADVGTTFRVWLPVAASAAEVAPEVAATVPGGARRRVLFVDDEPQLCESARRLLAPYGFDVVATGRAEEACAWFERDPAAYDAVITDLTMPVMTGIELARRILHVRPDLPVVVMTGYGGGLTPAAVQQVGIHDLLYKPLDFRAVALLLREITTDGPAVGAAQ
jgi:CheY-like chemotaxis protein